LKDVAASEARMVGLIGAANEAIVTLDESYWCRDLQSRCGTDVPPHGLDATGKPFSELIAPGAHQVEALLAQSDDPLNRPGAISFRDASDGSELPLECSVYPASGRPAVRIVVLNDVSERLRLRPRERRS
jgi:hypothetical protein